MSQAQTPTQKFVETVLNNIGFLQIIPAILSEIEDEIAGSYDAIDEEEDLGSAPSYGGVIYYTHNLVSDGEVDYHIAKTLNDSQKRLFLKFVENNNLILNVERTDWRQKWQFYLRPEIAPNTNERMEIDVEIEISVLNPKSFSITSSNENPDVNYDELLFLLTLAS